MQVLMQVSDGIDYSEHFEHVYADPPVFQSLLDRGQAESITSFPTLDIPIRLAGDKYKIVYGPMSDVWEEEGGSRLMLGGITVRDDLIRDRASDVVRLVRVFKAAIDHINADPAGVLEKYGEKVGLPSPEEQAAMVKVIEDQGLYDWAMTPERVESESAFLDQAVKVGSLDSVPDGVFYCQANADSEICQVVGE
jgi:hypothetical protein